MKKRLRSFLFSLFSLNMAVSIVPGFINNNGFQTMIIATILLAIFNYFVKPLLSLLLLPINLITLGSFKWLFNVILLYLIAILIDDLEIKSFMFQGFESSGFVIPSFNISKFFSLVFSSACFSLTNIFLYWLTSNKK